MMIMFSGARYAATASPSHIRDFERKILAALDNTPAFIQVFTPCNVNWGYNDHQAAEVTRLGVESGIWPLWEWKQGVFRRTVGVRPDRSEAKLREYLVLQRRYSHLNEDGIQTVRAYGDDLNRLVDRLALAFGETAAAEG